MSSPVRIVTVTVSDTRTLATDTSGRALAEELKSFVLVRHRIVPDEPEQISDAIEDADAAADAVILTGGTGISPRDNTFEAISSMFDKHLPGFGEAFRRLSWDEIGPRAMLSRAAAGTIGNTVIFLLPGSEKAVRLGARALIVPVLPHAVDLVNGRTHHPKT